VGTDLCTLAGRVQVYADNWSFNLPVVDLFDLGLRERGIPPQKSLRRLSSMRDT
jgi:hypothetical protein